MKTKELIRQLQEADPSGEIDCCIGNVDIHFVSVDPSHYDGCKQVLIRDEKNPFYNIIGAKVVSEGQKVVLHALSIKDILWDDPDSPIEYDEYSERTYKKAHDNIREEVREFIAEMENEENV